MGPRPTLTEPFVNNINQQLEAMCPIEDLDKRRAWRDLCLTQLSQMKKTLDEWKSKELSFKSKNKMLIF